MNCIRRALNGSARYILPALSLLAAAVSVTTAQAQTAEEPATTSQAQTEDSARKVLFILDASGSMWGEVGGEDKIVIAKRVMSDLVQQLPEGVEAGLEAYGHRSKGDCQDIEILVPPAPGTKEAMLEQIQAITPKGMTPITGSLQQAADALRETEQETTVVLVSDGEESCEADPCAAIEAIGSSGVNVRVHVVGFDVKEEERAQLECIADAGGGKYFAADDAAQLTAALSEVREVVTEAPKVEEPPAETETTTVKLLSDMGTVTTVDGLGNVYLVDPQSNEEIEGLLADGGDKSVPTGTYKVRYGPHYEVAEIEVKAGETVVLDADTWLATVKTDNGVGNVYLVDPESGDEIGATLADDSSTQIPAGTYQVRYGPKFEVDTIELQPGQMATLDASEWLGTVTAPKLSGNNLYLVDPSTDENVATIGSGGQSVQVPAGSYKVKLGQNEMGNIDVVAGKELVIE